MKLRIRGNSVRLRLTRTEVDALAHAGYVEDAAMFGPSPADRFGYRLEASDVAAVQARFASGRIVVVLPNAIAQNWAHGDDVGIEAQQSVDDGAALRILIEKDFACLKPRPEEDDGDAYPHPGCA